MTITHLSQLDPNGIYTYADYLLWQLKERVELLSGRIFSMSPAPSRRHQEVIGDLHWRLVNFFKQCTDKCDCKVYLAPFDVRLPQKESVDNQIYTVVQPDLCIICDPNKLDDRGAIGAPDLVIEVLSAHNSKKDLKDKYKIYEEAGIPEYWIVYPQEQSISVYTLEQGHYIGLPPVAQGEPVRSVRFPDMNFIMNFEF
ncbi:Uma2 family endonuclease [Capnocytophaga granulosa]|uniref:Uma2 family endonuclease n=1 Tax=Capnocytophaga granulosa TaxID=45242 RepID=UPI003C73AC19